MLIPIGILAGSGGATTAFEHISTNLISSTTASITFDVSALASNYKHLQLRGAVRDNRGYSDSSAAIRFNGDTGNNYSSHTLYGNSSNVQSDTWLSNNAIITGRIIGGTGTASAYSPIIVDILDFGSTTKNTTIRNQVSSAGAYVTIGSGLWISTAAVTSITLGAYGFSTSWVSGSRWSLYGIKG